MSTNDLSLSVGIHRPKQHSTLPYDNILSDILHRLTTLENSIGTNHSAAGNVQYVSHQRCREQEALATSTSGSDTDGGRYVWHDVSITKEMIRKWVNAFYSVSWGPQIPLEKSYFLCLSDIIDLPHVKIDTSALLLYYNVILHGLYVDRELGPNRKSYSQYIYQKIVHQAKDWVPEAHPTLTDLYAALLMIYTATWFFNRELSWRFHCMAYRIACNLGCFRLDADADSGHKIHDSMSDLSQRNQTRFCVWQLVHTDCLFRLHMGKPGLINPATLMVKFPELSAWNPHEELNRSVQISFLVTMRLAFAKLRYFELMDRTPSADTAVSDSSITELIRETQTALTDWHISEHIETANEGTSAWFYDELIQDACATTILLNRAKSAYKKVSPNRESLEAARKSIESMKHILSLRYTGAHWSLCYFSFYSVIAILTIFTHILQADELTTVAHDMSLTVWFEAMMVEWTTERNQLQVVENVVSMLNDVCRQVKLSASDKKLNRPLTGVSLDGCSLRTLECIGIEVHDLMETPYEAMLTIENWIYNQAPSHA
ncbi:hypothetical protein BDV25DRAFT_126729 [Aspergillus avenaceus]|uniref:Xylanolytic transcriptional activator regulatory domain-containing protein n=1 Tax=Aspergillus avenaceus TaxID=36643 RepID=A0A5N6U641_ASPAV|nr:hypothetical protein BDV25DRAFT_126729 [Aspergillus avenaceus]